MLTDDKVDGTAFIEGALLGAFHVSWNGDRLWANAAFAEALHYPDAQALAAAGTFWSLFAFAEEAEGLCRHLVEDGALRGWEAHLLGGDGMVQQFNLHVRRLQESDGVFLEGIAENISRRKLMEDVDEQATSKFKSIFDNAIEGMYQATPGGEFISINPALARSLGYDDPSALLWGGTIADHFADSDVGARFWRQLLEDGEVREFEAIARHTDGAVVWLKHHARCLRNPQGEIAYCEGMVEDITRRKMVEEELHQAKTDVERAYDELQRLQADLIRAERMAALGSMVAGVAHELNTPIGTAMLAASLLGSRSVEFRRQVEENTVKRSTLTRYASEMEEAAALIQGNITRASALVQAFKQVAVDNTAGERCTTAMAGFLRDVVAAQGTVLRKRGIAVRIECEESLTLDTYPTAINQMLSHFIINSVVHGYPADRSRGTITIGTALREDGAIELAYADDGIGIAPENLPRIFEPFFTTRRNQGSVGLGLNIVYNLVTSQLGGSISVSSVPDGGARFIIVLPAVTPRLLSESLRN